MKIILEIFLLIFLKSIMENQTKKENFDVNCNKLKYEFYKCLRKEDPTVGDEMRFMAKNKLNDINKFKIDKKILNLCNNHELIHCLNNKYRLREIEEEPLMNIFSQQYDKIMEKITRKKNKTENTNSN